MLALIAIFFPFIKGILGTGLVQSYLNAKTAQMGSAAEVDKVWIQAQVNAAQFELQRRALQRDLQLSEMQYGEMRHPKAMIMFAVAMYWFLRFMIEALGLGDFGVVIHPLSADMDVVSKMILAYLFLDGTIKRVVGK